MSHLVPCPECDRHVRSRESECPFCGAGLELSAVPARAMPRGRLGRAALFAFGAAIAGATMVGCGSDDSSGSGGSAGTAGTSGSGGTGGGTAGSGGTGGGTAGSGGAAGGGGQAGAAGSGGTAGMAGASGNGGAAGLQPLYGAPPFP